VLSAVTRIVVDVHACGQTITNEGGQIADQMAAKVTPERRPIGAVGMPNSSIPVVAEGV
jgi:hypothetical protein